MEHDLKHPFDFHTESIIHTRASVVIGIGIALTTKARIDTFDNAIHTAKTLRIFFQCKAGR